MQMDNIALLTTRAPNEGQVVKTRKLIVILRDFGIMRNFQDRDPGGPNGNVFDHLTQKFAFSDTLKQPRKDNKLS